MIHQQPHPLAGKTVRIKDDAPDFAGMQYHIEDYWDRISEKSWMFSDGNMACMDYAMRAGFNNLPIDNEVVYGKINGLGKLIHVSQLGEEVT